MPHKKAPATKKPKTAQTKANAKQSGRKVKQSVYKSFRLSKRIQHSGPKLAGSWSIFKASIKHLYQHKKLFIGITLVYFLLTLVLVRGFGLTADLDTAKEAVQELVDGGAGQLLGALTVFGYIMNANSPASDVGAAYQSILLIITTLALIWALRQTHANEKIKVKDSFYKGMYPLIPFVLVLVIIGIQLLPLMLGNFLYGATVASGLAATAIEKILWVFLVFLFAVWSLYMVSSSIFSLYIVTLPEVKPLQAIRSARGLVLHRRWTVMRKVIFLPFILVVILAAIMLPVIMFATPVAEPIFLVLTMTALAVLHSYMYLLYRELLK